MTKRNVLVALGVVVAGVGTYFLFFRPVPDEEQIARVIEQSRQAYERGRVGPFLKGVSESYEDANGVTKDLIRDGVRGATLGGLSNQQMLIDVRSIEVHDTLANADTRVTVVSLTNDGCETDRRSADVLLVFEKGDDGWQARSASGYEALFPEYMAWFGF